MKIPYICFWVSLVFSVLLMDGCNTSVKSIQFWFIFYFLSFFPTINNKAIHHLINTCIQYMTVLKYYKHKLMNVSYTENSTINGNHNYGGIKKMVPTPPSGNHRSRPHLHRRKVALSHKSDQLLTNICEPFSNYRFIEEHPKATVQ